MFSFLSDVMVLAGLYLAHSSQHKMKSVLLPVSVKKINIIRTELAICYPIKTWPWSSGTGFPTAQAATDSTPEEITMAVGRLIFLGDGRSYSVQLGRARKTLAWGFLLLLFVDKWNLEATRGR